MGFYQPELGLTSSPCPVKLEEGEQNKVLIENKCLGGALGLSVHFFGVKVLSVHFFGVKRFWYG